MENEINKVSCYLCGKDAFFYCEKKGYKLYKCPSCKLLFVSPTPVSAQIYDVSYFAGADKGFGYIDYDKDKEPMWPIFNKYLDIIANLGKKEGKILDVGCATGYFLGMAKERGFEVFGVEISDYAAEIGRKKGIDIKTGILENLDYPKETFDVITMFDVIEHVSDPKTAIQKAKNLLKNDGLLVINTPDSESLWAKVSKSKWHLIMPPEHLFYFSEETLEWYMPKQDFELVYSKKISKIFTFQYIFIMLYKWQKLRIWNMLSKLFSNKYLSKFHFKLTWNDNLFMIFKKNV